MTPATSFVLPVYNAVATIAETVRSILAQTDPDFELIVVDDGSTDATPRVLASFDDPRLRVITQPNGGITRALIAGCAAARGRYIARHDAGDISDRRRLAVQRAMLDASAEVVFVSCWTQVVGPELEPLFVSRGTGRAGAPSAILDLTQKYYAIDGPTHHGSVVFRRDAYEAVGGYRRQFYYGQDWDLWYRLAERGKFQMAPEVLYTARMAPGAISATAKAAQERIAALTHAGVRARAAGQSDAAFVEAASRIGKAPAGRCAESRGLYFIGEALRRNGDRRARRYLARAARSCPWLLRAWLRLAQSLFMMR